MTQVPDGLEGADLACYRFFAESGLAWPVDGVDADGRHWLALRRVDGNGASSVETLWLEAGSYRLVPGVPSYKPRCCAEQPDSIQEVCHVPNADFRRTTGCSAR